MRWIVHMHGKEAHVVRSEMGDRIVTGCGFEWSKTDVTPVSGYIEVCPVCRQRLQQVLLKREQALESAHSRRMELDCLPQYHATQREWINRRIGDLHQEIEEISNAILRAT